MTNDERRMTCRGEPVCSPFFVRIVIVIAQRRVAHCVPRAEARGCYAIVRDAASPIAFPRAEARGCYAIVGTPHRPLHSPG
jgi:hypothetical protein